MQEFDHIEIRGEGVESHLAARDTIKDSVTPLRVTELSCRVTDKFKVEVIIGPMVYSSRKAFASEKDATAFMREVIVLAEAVSKRKNSQY